MGTKTFNFAAIFFLKIKAFRPQMLTFGQNFPTKKIIG